MKGRKIKIVVTIGLVTVMLLAIGLWILSGRDSRSGRLPACENSNSGRYSVLETDNGYYLNNSIWYFNQEKETADGEERINLQYLRYYDKESGDIIMLCDKAECEHKGDDSCVATYQRIDVVNTVLYQGQLYIYGVDRNVTRVDYNLYKAALDGSSIDKIACIFSAENTAGEGVMTKMVDYNHDYYFIIHEGSAYLPYFCRIGKLTRGFKGGGLAKVDLQTGEVEFIYEMKDIRDEIPYELYAKGDYVYFGGSQLNGLRVFTQRYCISEDRLKPICNAEKMLECMEQQGDTGDTLFFYTPSINLVTEQYQLAVTAEYEYENPSQPWSGKCSIKGCYINAYSLEDGLPLPEKTFSLELEEKDMESLKILDYEDMVVLVGNNRVLLYSLKEDTWGKKLGEQTYEYTGGDLDDSCGNCVDFKLVNEKLYRICYPAKNKWKEADIGWEKHLVMANNYIVYNCNVCDILEGKGQWEFAYSY